MATDVKALRQLLLLGSAGHLSVFAAKAPKRIGILSERSAALYKDGLPWEAPLWDAMAELGWIQGQNVVVERALADMKSEDLPRLSEELVRKRVDVILCLGDQEAMVAASRATRTIPIIVFEVSDPVGQGLVESLARPGRNVTGISLGRGRELAMKRLQYLRTIAPSAKRLCWLLGGPTTMSSRVDGSRYDVAASLATAAEQQLQFETRVFPVADAKQISEALAYAVEWRAQALLAGGFPVYLARHDVVQFALRHRWPSVYPVADFVHVGGLLSLSVADSEVALLTRRWAEYIDRVLRGANPAELPVISADRYELLVNTKTAEALDLKIPPSILLQADALVR